MNRTCLVTGAASGIGKATRELLLARGDRVIGVDLHDADIEVDLTTPAGRATLAEEATKFSDGRVDAVFAIAGLSAPVPATIAVNYFGALATLTDLRPLLVASDAPRAVAVDSMASLHLWDRELLEACESGEERRAIERSEQLAEQGDGYEIYSTSKRALAQWIRRVAPSETWAGAGIPLNAIAPGAVVTPMTAELMRTQEGRDRLNAQVPMPLHGPLDAEVAAKLLAWLGGEENTHLCGQVIFIDGGYDALTRGDTTW